VVSFPSNDIYQIQLEIKQLLKAGQTPDLTRNGIARGYVVVPEFPSSTAIASFMIVGLFAVVIVNSKMGKRRSTI
jgi:thiamine biosynthesis protein ThiC